MAAFTNWIYGRVLSWRGREPSRSISLSLGELVYYVCKRGTWPWVRGWLWRLRFKNCGGLLLVGRNVNILFPRRIVMGHCVVVGDYSYVNGLARSGIRVGNNVSIREFAWIQATSSLDDPGEGLCIGDNTYIGPRSILGAAGGITIGSNVLLGAGVHLLAENHEFRDMNRRINQQGVTRKGIVIEDDVWIGNAAIVLDGVHIGRGAVIGAASVVTRDVSAFTVVAGNPARVIGKRQEMTERTVEKLVSAGSTV